MRLGELYWETEREQLVERFREWERKPIDQRGPAPEPNFDRRASLFARVLKDYQWFEQYDLALYVDGFLATEQGKQEEALDRFNRILADYPKSRFIPDAHMARAEAAFNDKYDYAGALVEYEKVMQYPQSDLYGLALFKSAWCQWRLGRSDEAAKRFLQVFQVTDARRQSVGAEAKAARRAPGRGPQVPRRGFHRRREEHRRRRVRLPRQGGRRQVRGQDRARRSPPRSTSRRTTSAASRPTSSC